MILYLDDSNHDKNLILITSNTSDVLIWWHQNSYHFPIVDCIVHDFLAVSVSEIDVENLFSLACDICHYHWNCLASETIEAIMLQMYVIHFAIKKKFEFQSDQEEYNEVSSKTDDIAPKQWISDVENADEFDKEKNEKNENRELSELSIVLNSWVLQIKNTQTLITEFNTCLHCTIITEYESDYFYNLNNGI